MQCAAVICLTVKTRTQDPLAWQELDACTEAIKKKYRSRAEYVSINGFNSIFFEDTQHGPAVLNLDLPELQKFKAKMDVFSHISQDWTTDRRRHRGVGLYIQIHGNPMTTQPSGTQLGALVAKFYEQGIFFKKINFGACMGAGTPSLGLDVDTGLISLCKSLRAHADPGALDQLMIAGYRTAITYKYEDGEEVAKKDGKDKRVRNFDQDHDLRLRKFSMGQQGRLEIDVNALSTQEAQRLPLPTDEHDDKLSEYRAITDKFRTAPTTVSREEKRTATQLLSNKDNYIGKLHSFAKAYISTKIIYRFNRLRDGWENIPLDSYSDSPGIQDAIQTFELTTSLLNGIKGVKIFVTV